MSATDAVAPHDCATLSIDSWRSTCHACKIRNGMAGTAIETNLEERLSCSCFQVVEMRILWVFNPRSEGSSSPTFEVASKFADPCVQLGYVLFICGL